ncbi:hypothetical protein Z517_09329 [Fonsecaea pedrosoi CBS 271.37]|uniref:Uncharacterized protein n=1 Tax=Fonsecaea pedrosoi CBS 271.37 TaxID=1442368 RepID=A0A0D2GE06_9EURO|nr:uncharacterized protein Z517_09329 [Fonsecaea pedrosoi CBS 271.37]KIW76885.1 hypothetical protein Z517_09329 [Fonsecaea pedrosoi CBS 271.37]
MDGADDWSWDSMFAATKKSETFRPPVDASIEQEAAITFDLASHGNQGPIHMSYPGLYVLYIHAVEGRARALIRPSLSA